MSMMDKTTMTDSDRVTKHIKHKANDQYYRKRSNFSRFRKVCCHRYIENKYFKDNVNNLIHYEKILFVFEYFQKKLLKQLSIDVSKDAWSNQVNRSKNISKSNQPFPIWMDWNKAAYSKFVDICGDLMREHGYEL